MKVVVRVPVKDVPRVVKEFSWAFWCREGGDVLLVRDQAMTEAEVEEVRVTVPRSGDLLTTQQDNI